MERKVGFKLLGPSPEDGLELLSESHDFYLRKSREGWAVDVFKGEVEDPGSAHVASEGFPTLGEALRYIGGWTPGGVDAFAAWGAGLPDPRRRGRGGLE